MKLGNIFFAFQIWIKISKLRMAPKVAYAILKYAKKIESEYEIAERQRVALIRELTKTEEGMPASIEEGTPEHVEYAKRFGEMLDVDSEIGKIDMKIDDFVDALSQCSENDLTAQELSIIEPFFAE